MSHSSVTGDEPGKPIDVGTLYSQESSFWKTYVEGRPQVPDSYFEAIFKYHAEHGGKFGTAHDAGAGGGVHSARLAHLFSKVIVSDPSEHNIGVARTHLHGDRYDFHVAKLEATGDLLPPASVDLVFAATMLHYTDLPLALDAVAYQLRPGGSFIVPCIGICSFLDEAVQKAHVDVFQTGVRQVRKKVGRALIHGMRMNGSGFDSVALPPEYFEPNSVRWKLNEPMEDIPGGHFYEVMVLPELREELPPESNIASTETVIYENDDTWAFRKDVSEIKAYLSTFPWDMEQEDMRSRVKALENAVGDRKMDGHYVVHTILATRK